MKKSLNGSELGSLAFLELRYMDLKEIRSFILKQEPRNYSELGAVQSILEYVERKLKDCKLDIDTLKKLMECLNEPNPKPRTVTKNRKDTKRNKRAESNPRA